MLIDIRVALFCMRTIKSVICALAVAACIEGIIPARRAASIDPAKSLRTE
jgi:ABC-type antimicrobial peptide transport system permease subunit